MSSSDKCKCSGCGESKNITAKCVNAKNINSKNICNKHLSSKYISTKDIRSENITSNSLKSININANNIDATTIQQNGINLNQMYQPVSQTIRDTAMPTDSPLFPNEELSNGVPLSSDPSSDFVSNINYSVGLVSNQFDPPNPRNPLKSINFSNLSFPGIEKLVYYKVRSLIYCLINYKPTGENYYIYFNPSNNTFDKEVDSTSLKDEYFLENVTQTFDPSFPVNLNIKPSSQTFPEPEMFNFHIFDSFLNQLKNDEKIDIIIDLNLILNIQLGTNSQFLPLTQPLKSTPTYSRVTQFEASIVLDAPWLTDKNSLGSETGSPCYPDDSTDMWTPFYYPGPGLRYTISLLNSSSNGYYIYMNNSGQYGIYSLSLCNLGQPQLIFVDINPGTSPLSLVLTIGYYVTDSTNFDYIIKLCDRDDSSRCLTYFQDRQIIELSQSGVSEISGQGFRFE